ncbi:MAG TPA: hypothetical protein VF981_09115 [Gemmatimonadaceae bacterium]
MPDESAAVASGAADAAPDPGVSAAGYRALQEGAVVIDRSDRLRMRFTGARAAETLNGLLTNEVTALAPGTGQYALALTPKGKIVADVRVLALPDALLLDTSERAAPGWSALVRKYVNPRLARYEDVSAELGDLGLFGAACLEVLRQATGAGETIPHDLAPYGHVPIDLGGVPVTVVRSPDYGVAGYDVFGDPATLEALRQHLASVGSVMDPGEALLVSRIEAGRPEWGVDMDESTLAQEADMERLGAISFTKGCYTGQETVARVHFRGHVNRLLRGLRFAGDTVPSPGSELVSADGKPVAVISSSARSPTHGVIALALVRREVEPGTTLHTAGAGAIVVELPFRN